MAIKIVVPRLGWSMEEGVFGQWLHQPGAVIKPGDLLYVLEGEKAAQDIESFDGGILHVPDQAPQSGEVVKVGQLLGYLLGEDETPPTADQWTQESQVQSVSSSPLPTAGSPGEPVTPVPGSGRDGPLISPRARRIAAELGIQWVGLTGTGSSGRIREQDILAAAGQVQQGSESEQDVPGELKPASRIRQAIARRLQESREQTVPVTLISRVDATNIVDFRSQCQALDEPGKDPVPSYTDILIKIVSEALAEYPDLNSQWRGKQLFVPKQINIAFAVDHEKGLLAPVIQDVGSKSLAEISTESAFLIAQTRDGSLREEALQGATFTITNLGMFGVDAFTPIINLPQSATLGVGQIKSEPVVVDGEVVVREQLTLSLTFDHRVVDGAPAARCLASIRTRIETWTVEPS